MITNRFYPRVKTIRKFGWFLIFTLFVSLNPSVSWGHNLNEEPFDFEITGTIDTPVFVPMLFPPNYTGTIPPTDYFAYETLVGRVVYSGTIPCMITSLMLWQGFTSWNRTQHQITPPSYVLVFMSTFTFTIEVPYSDAFVPAGSIFLKISTGRSGDFIISTSMPYPLTKIATWPLSFSATISIFFLFPSLIVIPFIVYRRRIRK